VKLSLSRITLTDRFVATTKVEGTDRADFFDARTPGLALRVTAGSRKTWTLHFTSPRDGKRARLTIGTYPATSLADARRKVIESRALLQENPPRDPRDVMVAAEGGAMTVAGLLPLYLAKPHRRTGQPRKSAQEIKRRFETNVLPVVGGTRLADLHRRDVNRVIAPIAVRAPTEAARVFEDFRGMVRWAVGQGYLDTNPMQVMEPPAKSRERTRALDEKEIRTLWHILPTALARSPDCQRIIKLCLVTGQRVGEVAGMRRLELDADNATWRIPSSRTKNGHEHLVPLSSLALEIIGTIEQEDDLFAVGGRSLPPAAVARTIARAHEGEGPSRFEIPRWSAHDLRRTVVSQIAKLGVPPIVLGHIINHRSVTKAGVTLSVYQQYDYEAEKRQALNLWADKLRAIVS
jgi:integrase